MANFREASKQDWTSGATVEHINAGSLQRIADATEKMAANYVKMENDLKCAKERRDYYEEKYWNMVRRNSALKGVITKLKKK